MYSLHRDSVYSVASKNFSQRNNKISLVFWEFFQTAVWKTGWKVIENGRFLVMRVEARLLSLKNPLLVQETIILRVSQPPWAFYFAVSMLLCTRVRREKAIIQFQGLESHLKRKWSDLLLVHLRKPRTQGKKWPVHSPWASMNMETRICSSQLNS